MKRAGSLQHNHPVTTEADVPALNAPLVVYEQEPSFTGYSPRSRLSLSVLLIVTKTDSLGRSHNSYSGKYISQLTSEGFTVAKAGSQPAGSPE